MTAIFPSELIILISSFFDQSDFESYLTLAFVCKRFSQLLLVPIQDELESSSTSKKAQQLLRPFTKFTIEEDVRNEVITICQRVSGRIVGDCEVWQLGEGMSHDKNYWNEFLKYDNVAQAKQWMREHSRTYFLQHFSQYRQGVLHGVERVYQIPNRWTKFTGETYVSVDMHYDRGSPHGPFKSWSGKDQPHGTGQYSYGLKVGMWLECFWSSWSSHGGRVKQRQYWDEKGQLISTEEFADKEGFFAAFPSRLIQYEDGAHWCEYEWHTNEYPANSFYILTQKTRFHNNLREGLCEEFHLNGVRKAVITFKKGTKNGPEITYQPDGTIIRRANYENGTLEGECQTYFTNGLIEHRYNYLNGFLHGRCQNWYEEGVLASDMHYQNGTQNGVCQYFYVSGSRKAIRVWENGRKKLETVWPEPKDDEGEFIRDMFAT